MENKYKNRIVIYSLIFLICLIIFLSIIYIGYIGTTEKYEPGKGVLNNLYNLLGFRKERFFVVQEILCPLNPYYIAPESIIPRPQNIEMINCDVPITVDSSWKILIDTNSEDFVENNFTAYYLKNNIFNKTRIDLEIDDINNLGSDKRIIIGNPNKNPVLNQVASSKGIDINLEQGFNQGYVLLIEPEQILIFANSTAGTFYGMITLIWLSKQNEQNLNFVNFPNTKITDWPDLKIRAFFGRKEPSYTQERWVDELAKYKYNIWNYGISRLFNNTSSAIINSALQMKEYLAKRHFYSALMLQPTDIASHFEPNLYEGFYAYNVSMKFDQTDYAVSLQTDNFQLNNAGFENNDNNDNMPDYWMSKFSETYGYWSYDCLASHSGKCSMKLTVTKNLGEIETSPYLFSSDFSSQKHSFYNLKPDKVYTLSFWVKKVENTNSGSGTNPTFVVQMKNPATGASYNLYQSIDVSNTWQKYSMRFSSASNFTEMIIFTFGQGVNSLQLWLDDFEVMELTDKLFNVIRTPDTRLHVWNKDRTVEYTEGSDYQLIESGQINIDNPVQGKLTKIKRIPTGSILENAEIKVDYDFVVRFYGVIWNSFSDPYFLEVYENNMVKPSMTIIKPEFVFINIDEIADINRDSRSKKRGLENYQLLANFVNNITKIIKSYNSNVKIIIWDDMQNPFHNGGNENYPARHGSPAQKTWYALDLLNRDLIQIAWWYGDTDPFNKMTMSPLLFNKYGFEFLAGPGVYLANNVSVNNIKWWSYLAYKYNALGMMSHSFYSKWDEIDTAGNYSWNAVKQLTTCSPDYIEICDGIDNDCDNIYYPYWTRRSTKTGPSNIDEGFNLTNDPFNCGNCGNICYYPKAYFSCAQGECQFDGCYEYYYNANKNLEDGCECKISNDGLEICDEIDNDCDGRVDEDVCPSVNDNKGQGGPIITKITNQTQIANQTNQTIPINQTRTNISINDTETPMPVKPFNINKFLKNYWIYIIIGIMFIISISIIKLIPLMEKNYQRKKQITVLRKNQEKTDKARELVQNLKQKGYSPEAIKKAFLENGWPEYLVELLVKD